MEDNREVFADLLVRGGDCLLNRLLLAVVLQKMEKISGVDSEEVDAVDQRLRAEVRPVAVRPVDAEDDERSVGRAVYSLIR